MSIVHYYTWDLTLSLINYAILLGVNQVCVGIICICLLDRVIQTKNLVKVKFQITKISFLLQSSTKFNLIITFSLVLCVNVCKLVYFARYFSIFECFLTFFKVFWRNLTFYLWYLGYFGVFRTKTWHNGVILVYIRKFWPHLTPSWLI